MAPVLGPAYACAGQLNVEPEWRWSTQFLPSLGAHWQSHPSSF
uniref:Uncharacterized protein n=1 Tax=Arundo donax TaxID=35708 RepID=A0A0A8ZDP8_ARUDO